MEQNFELNKQAFGAFLAQLRREKGWTQKDMAEKLYVSDKAVSKWSGEFPIVKDTTPNITTPRLYGT